METITQFVGLSPAEAIAAGAAILVASVVRGFAGFALSALIMASIAVIIPPVELIPLCWFLEMTASLLMVRGGLRDADRSIVTGLVVGSVVGVPVGLSLTTTLPVGDSKALALAVILVLAALQLFRVRARILATRPGLYASGLTAGIVTGLASVGGLVVALYVLARDNHARTMRASLVLFLFVSGMATFLYLLYFGLINATVLARAVVAVPIVAVGVIAGSWLFQPGMERHYRRFCLILLIGLATFGLIRLAGAA